MQNLVYKNNEDKNYSISETISGSAKINNLKISPEDIENYYISVYNKIRLYTEKEVIDKLNAHSKKISKRTFINHRESKGFSYFKVGRRILYNIIEIFRYYQIDESTYSINDYLIKDFDLDLDLYSVSTKELSDLLHVNEATIRDYVKNKIISYKYINKKYTFNYLDIVDSIRIHQ